MTEPLVCPSCASTHSLDERFCPACGMPLVYSGHTGVDEPVTEAHERARKIKPQFTEGELVRVVSAQHQAEAEMVQGILLEEGIPSMTRRSAGFDVPDMLAAGRRDVLVPTSGLSAARDVLMQADLLPAQAGPAVERPARLLGVLLVVVVFVGLVAWLGTEVLGSPHAPAQARRLRPPRLRDRPGLVADLLGRRRPCTDRGLHPRRVRRRHHPLRHRQRLWPRRRRARVGRDPRGLSTRLLRDQPSSTSPCPPRTAGSRASRSTSRSTAGPAWAGGAGRPAAAPRARLQAGARHEHVARPGGEHVGHVEAARAAQHRRHALLEQQALDELGLGLVARRRRRARARPRCTAA